MAEESTAWGEYLASRSEAAFERVVEECAGVVYSTALRKLSGDAILAGEVAQTVFLDLANRPQIVPTGAVLAGWLYRHTWFKASQMLRDLSRRREREQRATEVHIMNTESADVWENISPRLDDLMQRLKESDRDALILRYFRDADLKSVGRALGISEDAAQKKVSRALDSLRGLFMQSGVTVSATALAATLQSNAIAQAPVQVVAALTGLGTAAASQNGLLLIASKYLAMKTSTIVIGSLALLTGVSVFVLQQQRTTISQLQAERRILEEAASLAEDKANLPQITNVTSERMENVARMAREERLELMRLRDEVGRLRREQFAQSNAALGAASVTDGDTNSLQEILNVLWNNEKTEEAGSRRFDAGRRLRSLGAEAVQALPLFVDLLQSGDEANAYAGARALAFITEQSPEAFQQLTNALSDPISQVRHAAAHGVGVLFNSLSMDPAARFSGVNSEAAVPILVQNLRDSDRTVRADTASALYQYITGQKALGKEAQPELLIPALTESLRDPWPYARVNAAMGLGEYGPKARAATPELTQLLQDPDAQVKRWAEDALKKIARERPP